MNAVNMNDLARMIAEVEGKKHELSIAQVKEVLRSLAEIVAYNDNAYSTILKYLKKRRPSETLVKAKKK